MKKKISIKELMGASVSKEKELELDDLFEILGERMPKLEFTPVGRMRLISAFRNRFGENYRNLPGISKLLKEFDEQAEFNVKLQEMKQIKAKKG